MGDAQHLFNVLQCCNCILIFPVGRIKLGTTCQDGHGYTQFRSSWDLNWGSFSKKKNQNCENFAKNVSNKVGCGDGGGCDNGYDGVNGDDGGGNHHTNLQHHKNHLDHHFPLMTTVNNFPINTTTTATTATTTTITTTTSPQVLSP